MIEIVETADGRTALAKPLDCKGCNACCVRDPVPLHPMDDASAYKTREIDGQLFLKRQPNGNCVYLKPGKGCTIHKHRPIMCRNYDCRRNLVLTPEEREEKMARDPKKYRRLFAAVERHRP